MKKVFLIIIVGLLLGCQKDIISNKGNITQKKKSNRIMDKYFGHYKKPELLEQLEQYDNISDYNFSLGLGCSISYDGRYHNTPIDVIPFAWTGGDGVHFGFLTDFETVKDLNDAPIVCVSPLGDPAVQVVATNLKEFFALVISVKDIDDIECGIRYNECCQLYQGEDDILEGTSKVYKKVDIEKFVQLKPNSKEYQDMSKQMDINRKLARIDVIKMLEKKHQIIPLKNVGQYLKNANEKRQTKVTIQTEDGIGINYPLETPIDKVYNCSDKNIQNIKAYLAKASKSERIKFYRDAVSQYILSKDYDFEIREIIIGMLEKDGFNFEAKLLNSF